VVAISNRRASFFVSFDGLSDRLPRLGTRDFDPSDAALSAIRTSDKLLTRLRFVVMGDVAYISVTPPVSFGGATGGKKS
jgi:hypothetical protein